MKCVFSAIGLLVAMLLAVHPAGAEVPDHLYIMGHIAGTNYWEVSSACPEGTKTPDGKMFVFENIRIPNGWGAGVGTFGFVKDRNNTAKNGTDNYYGYLSPNNEDLDLHVGDKYKPLTHKAVQGYRIPEGTYTFTVDFTNGNEPTISVCRPEDLKPGSQEDPNDYDYNGYCPDLYISGEYVGWNNNNNLIQFSRNGNEYSVTVDSNTLGIGKQFKITTKDWTDNYGTWDFDEIKDYGLPFAVTPVCQGENNNFVCGDWGRFTIKFWYHGSNNPMPIYFLPEGYTGDLPDVSRPGEASPTGTLPVLHINVYTDETKTELNREITDYNLDHKNYFSNAEYWLDMNGVDWMEGAENLGSEEKPLALQIKARGNWTRRGFVKKPFKLKLDKKAKMLGLTNSKHFAILAHADDNMGYLRNYVGFNLGKRIGLPWTPQQQPVEVVINGDYRGVYFLTESIRVDSDRIDIEERDDNDEEIAHATGGYVIEFDNYADDDVWHRERQTCSRGHDSGLLYITPDTPEIYSNVQRDFVVGQFNAMHNMVMNHDAGLWRYLDMDDAVRYYLVEEIISHYEAYNGSTYLFRDLGEGQKWHYSPLWDCGHAFEGGTDNYFYQCNKTYGNTWIQCLKATEGFDAKLKETWKWFMSSQVDDLMNDIDTYCSRIAAAAKMDHKRWKDSGKTSAWDAEYVMDNSDMEAKKNYVKNYLDNKINWLQRQWGAIPPEPQAEPMRDATPAAELDALYKNNLPVAWNGFEAAVAGDHHIHVEDHIVLGTISNETTRANLSKTKIKHDTTYLPEGEAASVVILDNGEVHLIAPVPGVYDVTLTIKEHRADADTFFKETDFKQTVTVRPTFGGFGMTDAEISINENGQFVIDYTPNNPWAVKFWSPYGNPYDSTGFDELYYTVLYPTQAEPQNGMQKVPAARAEGEEIPHGLANRYDNEKGVNIDGASGLKMALKVSGAVSDPQEFGFISQGGVVTGVGAVDAEADTRYFDLNGYEMAKPAVPGVYIRVSEGKTTKIVIY